MYFSAKTSRIVFLYVLLLFLLPATAQNKNEKQAEQKKLEQIITESKAVADKI